MTELKKQLNLPNGEEKTPVTINDIAIQLAKCQLSRQGCDGYVSNFSFGVMERGESETASQIVCVKSKEVSSDILTGLLVKDMPTLGVTPSANLSDESAAEEEKMLVDRSRRMVAFTNSTPGPGIGTDRTQQRPHRRVSIQIKEDVSPAAT